MERGGLSVDVSVNVSVGNAEHGEHTLRVLLKAEALHVVSIVKRHNRLKAGSHEVAYYLWPFSHKEAFALAVFLLFQRANKLLLCFCNHAY